ncbi:MAG: Hsp20/alpha crystallin family protein [Acetobacteraceae bacterium]|nr:Hsp20/alpha crystallin family protein [Acetobacteraceae bacterium]
MAGTATKMPERVEQKVTESMRRPEGLLQPLAAFRNEMERLFNNSWRDLGAWPSRLTHRLEPPPWRFETAFGMATPAIDVVDAEKEYRVIAELPGMDAGDVELLISGDMLTIKGEKKEEKEEKAENYYLSERRFGSFQRSFQLPQGIDCDRTEAKFEKGVLTITSAWTWTASSPAAEAKFEKGVLTITLPKTAEAARQQKKIEIKPSP